MRCERSNGPSGDLQTNSTDHTSSPCEESPRALLPSPLDGLSSSADIGAQIAGLIVCLSREQRESAHQARQAAEKAQRAAEDSELEEMSDEAGLKLASGIVQGSAQIASGAMTASSAFSPCEVKSKLWSGLAKTVEGDGKLKSAMLDYLAAGSARDAKEATFAAGHAKTAVDDARDLDKDARETMNRALSYYKEYLTAKADTQRATLLKA